MNYKDMLSNQLRILINEYLNKEESINKKTKVEALDEKEQKRFYEVITDYVLKQARDLANIQGTSYLGVKDEVVESWVSNFFNDFDKHMKKPEPKPKKKSTPKRKAKPKEETYKVTIGLFGTEVTIGKEILTKSEFEERFKDKHLIWGSQNVKVTELPEVTEPGAKELIKEKTEVESEDE